MKIEITKGRTPLSDSFATPLSAEGEAEFQNLRFVDSLMELMREQSISRIELARRMGVQPSRVTAMLAGNGNFTTETMIRAARAVGAQYHHCLAPAAKSVRWQLWDDKDVHPAIRRPKSDGRKTADAEETSRLAKKGRTYKAKRRVAKKTVEK